MRQIGDTEKLKIYVENFKSRAAIPAKIMIFSLKLQMLIASFRYVGRFTILQIVQWKPRCTLPTLPRMSWQHVKCFYFTGHALAENLQNMKPVQNLSCTPFRQAPKSHELRYLLINHVAR